MTGQTIGLLLVMIIYLILMVGIGVLYSKKNNDVSDFYLGGRKLGPIVTAMSAEASDMSSWLLMGLPGVAYLSGCAEAGWTAIGLAIGTYLNWLIVAKRLRRYTHKANNSITLPAFFENRYRDKSHALMAISAIMIVIFFVPYTASGFAACGKLFFYTVWCFLSSGNDYQRDRHCFVHHSWWIPCRKHDGSDSEYHHDNCTLYRCNFRYPHCRRI